MVLLAAGRSARFGADKLVATVGGRSVISMSLDTFVASPLVERVVVVAPMPSAVAAIVAERHDAPAVTVVAGGATRHLSEKAGLEAVLAQGATELIAFHDAARPFATNAMLAALVDAARSGGAVPVLPPPEPLYRRDGQLAHPMITQPLLVQTPQVFPTAMVVEAFGDAGAIDDIDTSQTVARTGATIAIVPGDERNLKITHTDDLARSEEIVKE